MPNVKWIQAIEQWRSLPESEKHAIRWRLIPRSVAQSMAFAGELGGLSASLFSPINQLTVMAKRINHTGKRNFFAPVQAL